MGNTETKNQGNRNRGATVLVVLFMASVITILFLAGEYRRHVKRIDFLETQIQNDKDVMKDYQIMVTERDKKIEELEQVIKRMSSYNYMNY